MTGILLVSCYELGHQPLALASPLAFLERAGHAAEALDISVEPFESGRFVRARFVAISVPMHTALRLGVRVAEQIRRVNPGCHICFYGLYASLNADYLLEHCGDSAIGGEYEAALVALVESLDGSKELVGYVEASRGCLHLCLHCPIPPVYGGRFFIVPQDIVLDDIRGLARDGATHITFGDPDFLNGPGHSLAIARAMHAELPSMTFDFTAKVEHILERAGMFPELNRLGCVFMVSAVESLSDTVLANLEKGHTRADVARALQIVRAAGIAFRPTWVPFTPWTTLEDYLEVFDFVEEEGLIDQVDPVQFTLRLLVPPGSSLLTRQAIRPHLGALDQAAFIHRWTHPDARMDVLQREASRLVEAAANADPAATFYRLKALAGATAGRSEAPVPTLAPDRRRPPRLTEAWFC